VNRPHSHTASLDDFLRDQCEATKAKYAAELANACAAEWRSPLDYWCAESLVHFGLLVRRVERIYSGRHVQGSRSWFMKTPKTTTTVSISAPLQTAMEFT
jgi:hypothetical protein